MLVVLSLFLQACSFTAPSYQAADANKKILVNTIKKLAVVHEKSSVDDESSIMCRTAGSVSLPGGMPFSEYLLNALKDELKAADKLDEKGEKLFVKLMRISFTTAGSTNWYIDASYRIADKNITIATVYNDRSSFAAISACNNVARYFSKAVETHLSQLFNDPVFQTVTGYSGGKSQSETNVVDKLRQLDQLRQEGLISEADYIRKKKELIDAM